MDRLTFMLKSPHQERLDAEKKERDEVIEDMLLELQCYYGKTIEDILPGW